MQGNGTSLMDTYRILLDGQEVARISGEALELGRRTERTGEIVNDPKCIKKSKFGQALFVLMASSMKNVSVERLDSEQKPA